MLKGIYKGYWLGKKRPSFSEEWKANISKGHLGRKTWNKGKVCPSISKGLKGNKNHLGKKHSDETRKKMSEKRKGKPSPMLGHHHSYEAKKKLSVANKGRHHSEEAKRKISEFQKGKKRLPFSKEWIRKISKANKGKHHSEETKRKMSKNNAKFWFGKCRSEETKKKLSEALKGEKSSLWRGGISFEPYTVDWNETLRRAIRERDHYICYLCFKYGNYVHHIDYDKKNCDPKNLITLCVSCHAKTNFNREYWIKYFLHERTV